MANPQIGIREISIENFRGIEQIALKWVGPSNLPTQVVVLGGPNGCGKTSILEACLLACGHPAALRGKYGSEAIRHGTADYRIEISTQSRDYQTKVTIDSKSKPKEELPCSYFSSWRAPGLIGPVSITAGKKGRRPDRTEANRFWRIKQFFVNAQAHELFPTQKMLTESRFQRAISDLNHVWQMFYPEQKFVIEPVRDDPDAGFEMYLLQANESRLSIEFLSSGQLEIFSLAGGLIIDDFQEGIVIIDEPELHLDPQWHRQLLRALLHVKPNCQVLVATHSPEIFDSVRSFERHFLIPSDDPRAHSWKVPADANAEVD